MQTVLVANIPDPEFVPISDVANPRLQNPRLQNPTLALAPGESATLTLRIVDPNRFDGVTYDASGAVTPAAVAQSVNTEDVAAGSTTPPVAIPLTIATTSLATDDAWRPVLAVAADRCGRRPADLQRRQPEPCRPDLTLSSAGTISGTPTTPGNYRFTVRCVDASGNADDQQLFCRSIQRCRLDSTPSGTVPIPTGPIPTTGARVGFRTRRIAVYISAAIPTIADADPRRHRSRPVRRAGRHRQHQWLQR